MDCLLLMFFVFMFIKSLLKVEAIHVVFEFCARLFKDLFLSLYIVVNVCCVLICICAIASVNV